MNKIYINAGKAKAMIVENPQRRIECTRHAPFNAGNRPLMFVEQFNHSGII